MMGEFVFEHRRRRATVAAVLAIHASALPWASARNSLTTDDVGHLPAAIIPKRNPCVSRTASKVQLLSSLPAGCCRGVYRLRLPRDPGGSERPRAVCVSER